MIYTSYFGNQKNIAKDMELISIARGSPRGFQGRSIKDLAPTWAMLKLSREEYDRQFNEILEKLSAREIFERIGQEKVLLCWEPPKFWCHRRRVAEWLEAELGITVPELGMDRASLLPYAEMPEMPKKKPRNKRSQD